MSLSGAISSAQASLSNTSTQTAVISRNISNANNPDYARRDAVLATSLYGANVVTTQRAQDTVLFRASLKGTAESSAQTTLLDGLSRMKDIYGGNDYESSPASLIATMRDTLATFAAKPGETTLAATAIADATLVAAGLRDASAAVQTVRSNADQQISLQVDKLNDLLARFKVANDGVFAGTQTGRDVNNELDERDNLLKQISEIVGVSTVSRAGNDMALYTSDGTALFETVPRPVTFVASGGFSASIPGNKVYIDGVPLSAGQGASTTATGSLQAQLQIRDDLAPTMQRQLDEIARGLVATFSEKDQSAVPTLPDAPGLFTWVGGNVPAAGTLVAGMAATIQVNPALLSNPNLLRDGGINGAAYTSNTTGAASYSALLDSFVSGMDAPMTFDASAGIGTTGSLTSFAADSVGWLELNRSDASSSAEIRSAYLYRASEAHSSATGVSLDEEMSLLLDLEQSYKAAARLLTTVDTMMQALLAVVR
ncbi:flagellar hook-associated protein 1 FlgK [Hoeflea marina]|uniref:Flagellar hook-associated protein 1 n=1 Tax=Hoeflea marina TaxID=274592 RepID=A0A317PDT3_9HYPH|nr:flagellar hook-associated protein FlgK [Hoeflea marina]PWV95252.1 flagellar hook-associated protein 1 FlgK [Hoeflea marina]